MRDIEFKNWILQQRFDGIAIIQESGHQNEIRVDADAATGRITFHDQQVIELEVNNRKSCETIFYLHFQLKTLQHAIDLFREMIEAIRKADSRPQIRVLLCCSTGMTTSFFAARLNEGIRMLELDIQVEATSYQDVYVRGAEYDVILLAPQISYMREQIQSCFTEKPVRNIPARDFAGYHVGNVIALIRETRFYVYKKKELQLSSHIEMNNDILVLAIVINTGRVHVAYRLYGSEHKLLVDHAIVKDQISILDLYDIIDLVLMDHHVDKIGISVPGIINDNLIHCTHVRGLKLINCRKVRNRYTQEVYFYNDVNCAAVGYYASQNEYQSLSLLFQPVNFKCGIGHVINGQLYNGYRNFAGEVKFLPLVLSADRMVLNKTPEGMVELVSQIIQALITVIAPPLILVECCLLRDAEQLRRELSFTLPNEFIPEIRIIHHLHNYCLLGMAILCNDED